MKKKVMIFLVDWLLYENAKEEEIHYKQFYGHFFRKERLYAIQKLRDTLSIFGKKIRDK